MQNKLITILKKTEKYTKTDMVYLAKSSFWLNANFIVGSFLSFILSIFLANFVSKETMGMYQYIVSAFGILTAFTLTGMNTVVTRDAARNIDGTFQQSIIPQLKSSLLISTVTLIGALWYLIHHNQNLSIAFVILAITIPIITTYNTYNAFLVGKKDFKTQFIYNTIINILYYAGLIITILITHHYLFLVLANFGITAIATWWMYRKTVIHHVHNTATDPSSMSDGIHFSISKILPMLLITFDSIIVYHLLGPVSLAIYSIISNIPLRLNGIVRSITTAATPKFSEHNPVSIRGTITAKTFKIFLASLFVCGIYALLTPTIFHYLFPAYAAYVSLAILFAFVAVIASTVSFTTSAVSMIHNQKSVYILNTLSALFTFIFLVFGGLWFGVIGVIVGRLLGYTATLIISLSILLVHHQKEP